MHATGILGGTLQGIGLILSSGMAVCILHALLTYLPLCFTVGERSSTDCDMPSCATQTTSMTDCLREQCR